MVLRLPTCNPAKTLAEDKRPVTIYSLSGKNMEMQMKGRKQWCEQEESRPSFPPYLMREPATCKAKGKVTHQPQRNKRH